MNQTMSSLSEFSLFIRNGASIKQTDGASGDPITRIETIANRTVNLAKCGYADVSSENYSNYLLQKGDILISHINSTKHLGKCAIFEGDEANVIHGMNLLCLRVDEDHAYPKYVFYMLSSFDFLKQLPKITKNSVNQSSFNVKSFQDLKIPLPPLETQKQIAAVLEKADQLRKDCQQMEQELNGLAQSVFIDMFGDQLTSPHDVLGNVSNVVSGVTKGQKHNNKVIVKAPYMRVANVQAGYLNLNEIKEIEVKESDVEKYKLEVGDVLLTEGGDHDKLGRGAIWNGEVDNCIHQNHVFRVRLDTELYTSQWFNGYLKTDFAKRYFLKCAKKTTNLASINITQLKGLPMPDIDIKEQVRFEKIITSINSQMLSNTELAHQYDENFNALMQKAFKGELNL